MDTRNTDAGTHLVKGLDSGALNEVLVGFGDAPVDLSVQLSRLRHPEVVHLAVEGVEQRVEPCCDEPPALHEFMCKGFIGPAPLCTPQRRRLQVRDTH